MTSTALPTIPELLKSAAQSRPQATYLRRRVEYAFEDETYFSFYSSVCKLASELTERGTGKGDKVALWSENSREWIVAYFAILHVGAIVVPFDPQAKADDVERLCRVCGAKGILLSANQAVRWGTVAFDRSVFALEEFISKSNESPELALAPLSVDASAMIIFTSGTTGDPKGVVLTHRNLVSDAMAVTQTIQVADGDNFLLLLPLFHTYSCTVNLLCSLAAGAIATLATGYKSRDLIDDIRVSRVTLLIGVPQLYENIRQSFERNFAAQSRPKRIALSLLHTLARAGRILGLQLAKPLFSSVRNKAGFASMRLLVSGGAALRPEVNNFFRDLGFELVQGYGLTEASPVLSCNPPEKNLIGSVGPAVNGAEFKIDQPNASGIGEICARGPMIMSGYYNNPAATAQVLHDGWLYTGDAGFLDLHGYLHITGRLKNVIVTAAGKNIYPEEIEAELNLSHFILESLVLAVPGPKGGGEELVAWIVPDPEALQNSSASVKPEIEKHIAHYNHQAPIYRRIRRWKIRGSEFEKTSTRKIRRFLYKSFDE